MDHVYGLYNNNASSKVHVKEYFDEYIKVLESGDYFLPTSKNEKNIEETMGVSLGEEEMSMLTTYCSVDNLTVEGEPQKIINNRKMRRRDVFDPQEPPDVDLKTIQNLRKRWKHETKRPNYKYQSELFINHDKVTTTGDRAVPGRDFLIFLRVYNPFKHRVRNAPLTQCGSKLILNNVTSMLGFQTLTDLRDKIPCINDQTISKESSNDLKNAVGPMAKDIYKSGFFYIEDTFYNDTRSPDNVDYSKVILEWMQRRPELGPFKTAIMEECRLDSLRLRFGYPWVYKHQGGCEHLIIFSDARLVTWDDELAVSAYPRIERVRTRSSKLCMICGVYSVQWITTDHDRIPHNPCFFCDSCFKSYNYIDDKKVGKFKAYAYPRNTELVNEETEK